MGKKGGGKKGKGKGKKGPVDWGAQPRETYVDLELRNSCWQSMRFTKRLPTSTKLSEVVQLIVDRHEVTHTDPSRDPLGALSLYLGEEVDPDTVIRPEEYGLSLKDIKVAGGSINDHVVSVITYDYGRHRTGEVGTLPPSKNYGVSHLPRDVLFAPLRQYGPA